MNARLTRLLVVIAAAALLGAAPRAGASIIDVTINNYSFETPNLAGLGGIGAYTGTTPPGWTDTTGLSGVYRIGSPTAPGHIGDGAPDGSQVGYVLLSTLWQQTSAVLTDEHTYQLSLAIAQDGTTPSTLTYALYSGTDPSTGTLLAEETTTVDTHPNPDEFENVTVTFGPDDPGYAALLAAHAGENIIVALTGVSGTSVDVDDVQLLDSVPEPASLGLLACGSLLMLRRRRA